MWSFLYWIKLFHFHWIFREQTFFKCFSFTTWKVSKHGVFLVRIFPHSNWIRRDTEHGDAEYLSVFSPNAENTDQKKFRTWTLFTQCMKKTISRISRIIISAHNSINRVRVTENLIRNLEMVGHNLKALRHLMQDF